LRLNDTIAYQGLSNTYTYTNICQLAAERDKLYLFWRGADYKPNVSVSLDSGRSWEQGKILILPERIYKDRRPYIKITSNNKDVIHFAFTDGHPNAEPTNSIYYAKYRDGALYKANGEKIIDWSELPLSPNLSDIAYDATQSKEKAWIWDVAENKDGNPVLVYSRFPTDSSHVYYYTVWDNNKWNHHLLTNSGRWFPQTQPGKTEREPNYSGGIVLDHEDPSIVYLSTSKNGVFEIEKWTTPDKGNDWKVEEITSHSEFNNVRPFVIRNHPPADSLSVLWLNVKKYVHYTDYETAVKMNVR
jgi:BNR repeat-containing family member